MDQIEIEPQVLADKLNACDLSDHEWAALAVIFDRAAAVDDDVSAFGFDAPASKPGLVDPDQIVKALGSGMLYEEEIHQGIYVGNLPRR